MTVNLDQIITWVRRAIVVVLTLMFAVMLLQMLNVSIGLVPLIDPLKMLYAAAGWAFLSGGVKLR